MRFSAPGFLFFAELIFLENKWTLIPFGLKQSLNHGFYSKLALNKPFRPIPLIADLGKR